MREKKQRLEDGGRKKSIKKGFGDRLEEKMLRLRNSKAVSQPGSSGHSRCPSEIPVSPEITCGICILKSFIEPEMLSRHYQLVLTLVLSS